METCSNETVSVVSVFKTFSLWCRTLTAREIKARAIVKDITLWNEGGNLK